MPTSLPPLPAEYDWLLDEPGPRILKEAVKLYGVLEGAGDANSPVILGWAKEVGGWIGNYYTKDSIPWCGLFCAVVAKRAEVPFTQKALSALEWKNWGAGVEVPMLGDVLVFKRMGGGHVGIYVGEDANYYHVLGGNQSDKVCITRIQKFRLVAARRGPDPKSWNIRVVKLSPTGNVSENES